jgi:Calcineurin-like phosphoesterase
MESKQKELLEKKIIQLSNVLKTTSKTEKQGFWSFLWDGYQTDEKLLIQLMNAFPPTNGPYPSPTTPGNLEFSWVLYFLNITLPQTPSGKWLQEKLTDDFDMPPANPTLVANWSDWEATWSGEGVLLGDGSLVSTQLFAVMDPGWSLAVIDYIRLQIDLESLAPFNTNPNSITINPENQTSLTIAIMGDWGTGNYQDGSSKNSPSNKIMTAIANLKPDIVVHLGDVYYAGSDNFLIFNGEEQVNLIDVWNYNAPLGNFTLNSNHEMYGGANGYFNVALASDIFKNQIGPNGSNPTSYFSITYGDCVIVGLDTAYNATGGYMQGRITDDFQPAFLNQFEGKNVIVLSHHNPIDTLGQELNPLWEDVTGSQALNGPPAMWYWGHIHNGIVYNNTAATQTTLARCLGNGAIPIGKANWLLDLPTIDYFTQTPLGDSDPNNALRVKNGFAILTIENGVVSENWYDQDGNQSWNN